MNLIAITRLLRLPTARRAIEHGILRLYEGDVNLKHRIHSRRGVIARSIDRGSITTESGKGIVGTDVEYTDVVVFPYK